MAVLLPLSKFAESSKSSEGTSLRLAEVCWSKQHYLEVHRRKAFLATLSTKLMAKLTFKALSPASLEENLCFSYTKSSKTGCTSVLKDIPLSLSMHILFRWMLGFCIERHSFLVGMYRIRRKTSPYQIHDPPDLPAFRERQAKVGNEAIILWILVHLEIICATNK